MTALPFHGLDRISDQRHISDLDDLTEGGVFTGSDHTQRPAVEGDRHDPPCRAMAGQTIEFAPLVTKRRHDGPIIGQDPAENLQLNIESSARGQVLTGSLKPVVE